MSNDLPYFKFRSWSLKFLVFAAGYFCLAALGGEPGLADDWPMLFHDPGRTCASADTKVKPPFRMLWRYAVDGFRAHGGHTHNPIVADGIVYISGVFHERTPQKTKIMLLALDGLKGTAVWSKEGNFSVPAVSHGMLHTVQWKETGKDAPVDYQAIALQAKTGEVRWQVKILSFTAPDPYVVVQEDLLFIMGRREIVALDRETGKQLWEWSYKEDAPSGVSWANKISGPVIDENGVYFTDFQRNVNCLDPKTGKLKWKKENFIRRQFGEMCATVVADGILVIREGGWIGGDATARQGYKIYALSTKDGSILWRRGVLCGGRLPLLAKNTLYMYGSFGEMLALDARTGAYLWDRSQIAGNGRACGSLLYANGVLYFYTGHGGGLRRCALLCVDAGSGEMLWTSCDRGGLGSSSEWFWEAACRGPSFANGIVYLAAWWGGIFALAPDEGQPE